MGSDSHKTLILMRHAETMDASIAQHDIERSLTTQGKKDAVKVGNYIADMHPCPDIVLCSSARRARETLDHMRSNNTLLNVRVEYDDRLYKICSTEYLTDIISEVYENTSTLMMIGHNPIFADYVNKVAIKSLDASCDVDRHRSYFTFLPASVAVMTATLWDCLCSYDASIECCHSPRSLPVTDCEE